VASGTTTENTAVQLKIALLKLAFKDDCMTSNQPTVNEAYSGTADLLVRPSLLSPLEKVALFADLFATRRDVYAVRWQNNSSGKKEAIRPEE
jgi:hypothetical protein